MHSSHVLLRSRHTVTPDGVVDAVVWSAEGTLVAVLPPDDPAARGAEDLGDLWLLPGLVDTHVHVNEPGRTEWEGFESATHAAAAGGITTIVDMPLNAIPATTTADALRRKVEAAEGKLAVDVGFWGGVVPGNAGELEGLAREGVVGFKCFLSPSGVDEFANVTRADLEAAAPTLKRLGLPLLVHAEHPAELENAAEVAADDEAADRATADPRSYRRWLDSRPASAETMALAMLTNICRRFGIPIHIVHLAAGDLWHVVAESRAQGLKLSAETCPHYLTFAAEDIPDGAPLFKCAPPIREAYQRESLWEGLRAGAIQLVASDHSPCPPAMKRLDTGDVEHAWGGIASLELGFGAVWAGAHARGFTPADVVRWMSDAPARLARLAGRKGAIAPGCDADLVVWDPNAEWVVDPARLFQRHKVTPYAGRTLRGRVRRTYVNGRLVFADGKQVARAGDVLLRSLSDA